MADSNTFYPRLELLIDGRWQAASDGATRPVINPSTEDVIGALPVATADDTQRALDAAQRGFNGWRRTAPGARAAIIVKAATLLRERADAIARTITLELGKPLAESLIEVDRLAAVFDWHAAEALRAYGRIVPAAPGIQHHVVREPVGVVAAFTPWNGPAASPGRKMSAALAAGCAVVIKPAEETPGTAIHIAHCLMDAGLPPGVLNVVFGDPGAISSQLIASPITRAFAFTGSVPIGRHLATLAAQYLKPAVMELGGHSPVIVCADADPVKTAQFCARTKYRNAGQICMSPTRFYVHESIEQRFTDAFIETANSIKVGSGFTPGMEMGPLANARRRDAMEQLIGQATGAGAKLRAGGTRIDGKGFFFRPAVLTDLPDTAEVLQTEPFGPIGLIAPFGSLEDAIRCANGTPYGLAGYAFTDSAAAADQIGTDLECGVVSINHFHAASHDTPFGGVKDSGYGREGGAECFEGYLGTKLISNKTR